MYEDDDDAATDEAKCKKAPDARSIDNCRAKNSQSCRSKPRRSLSNLKFFAKYEKCFEKTPI
jgi:hypothetical protein